MESKRTKVSEPIKGLVLPTEFSIHPDGTIEPVVPVKGDSILYLQVLIRALCALSYVNWNLEVHEPKYPFIRVGFRVGSDNNYASMCIENLIPPQLGGYEKWLRRPDRQFFSFPGYPTGIYADSNSSYCDNARSPTEMGGKVMEIPVDDSVDKTTFYKDSLDSLDMLQSCVKVMVKKFGHNTSLIKKIIPPEYLSE